VRIGLPVPPGFTITTDACRQYLVSGKFPETLDAEIDSGVGILLRTAVDLARGVRSDFKLGVCGEHGGDPRSIHFFNTVGLDYVSC
jgi:pyruvate,orthophosphate dikinase